MAGIRIDEVGTYTAPNSITSSHLADSAVTTPKLSGAAVNTARLADLSVTNSKLVDNAVDPSKSTKAVRRRPYKTNSNEVSVTGTTSTEVKAFRFAKSNAGPHAQTDMAVAAELRTSNTLYAATMEIFFDAEATPRATLSSSSTNYDLQSTADIDISAISTGVHEVSARLKSSDPVATASNREFEFYLVGA